MTIHEDPNVVAARVRVDNSEVSPLAVASRARGGKPT